MRISSTRGRRRAIALSGLSLTALAFATHGGLGGGSGPAEVSVFDARGRWIRTIARGDYPAGHQAAAWDGRDSRGALVSAGVYFLQATTAGESRTMKFVVLR